MVGNPKKVSAEQKGSVRTLRRPVVEIVLLLPLGLILNLALVSILTGLTVASSIFSGVVFLVGWLMIISLFRHGYPHPSLGYGNAVTFLRFVILAALSSALVESADLWVFLVLALISLIMDGIDGYLARSEGYSSDFGARLDMEVDSALALLLAVNLLVNGIVSPLVLVLGLPRYLFVIAYQFLPWLKKSLPYSFARRVVSVIQIATLIGLSSPLLPEILIEPVTVLASGILLWSFGRDIHWLWRARSQ